MIKIEEKTNKSHLDNHQKDVIIKYYHFAE